MNKRSRVERLTQRPVAGRLCFKLKVFRRECGAGPELSASNRNSQHSTAPCCVSLGSLRDEMSVRALSACLRRELGSALVSDATIL